MLSKEKNAHRSVTKLLIVVVLMFGFGYALVPLYDLVCDITGLNGKTGQVEQSVAVAQQVDESRSIKVQFVASVNAGAPWDFKPNETELIVHPGAVYQTTFKAVNKTPRLLVGQAVPSLVPREASLYFNKTDCFCFRRQDFKANESRDMPVQFIVDRDIPAHIDSLVLSYTFFDITASNQGT